MLNRQQQLGKKGESLAARLLKKKGYKIIARNYQTKLGEIDIIAEDRGTLVFVEVKTRASRGYGHPKTAVTPLKQRKISMAALTYLKATRQTRAKARFDVVSIHAADGKQGAEIIQNAFELAYP